MKIAIFNRDLDSHPGGDQIAILALQSALQKRGHKVWYAQGNYLPSKLKEFDIAHVQHCQFGWAWANTSACYYNKLPYILIPMWYEGYSENNDYLVKQVVKNASMVCPFSRTEAFEMAGLMSQFNCIPNGTDPKFHSTKSHDQRNGVICVAARPGKGEEIVASICKKLNIPFHFVTGLKYESMPSIYKNARVLVNASGGERMSLTTAEALCAGCRVIDTIHNRGNEWYLGIVKIDPKDEKNLKYAINCAYDSEKWNWNYTPNEIARQLTWDFVAEKYEGVYESCM